MRRLHGKLLGQAVLMLLQLLCVLALWNNDAPPFIYIAF